MKQAQGMNWLHTESLDLVQATLLPFEPVQPVTQDVDRGQVIHQLVLDPVYQLK